MSETAGKAYCVGGEKGRMCNVLLPTRITAKVPFIRALNSLLYRKLFGTLVWRRLKVL